MAETNARVETGRDPNVYSSQDTTHRKHRLSTAPVAQFRLLEFFVCGRTGKEDSLFGSRESSLGNGMSVDRTYRV